ncbi:TerC family protein [Pseudalkalibacillus caeni]
MLIIGIDLVLGGDNAIVIALASRKLPDRQRNKAIFLGTLLAVFIRVSLTMIAVHLLQLPYLLILGGLLLIWIAYNLLVEEKETETIHASRSLLGAIRTIVVADLVMGLDNVLAIAGAANGDITLIIIGLLISVPIIIWGSKLILLAMEQFPALIYIGAGILSLTAGKMITSAEELTLILIQFPALENGIQFAIITGVILAGWTTNRLRSSNANS